MPLGQIICLAQDKDHNFLTGTTAGAVSRYDTEKGSFTTLFDSREILRYSNNTGPVYVFSILEDSKGNIWATGLDHGVFRYEKSSGKTLLLNTSNGLSMNKVKCLAEDAEGNVLLGTSGEGFEVYSGERFVSYNKNNGLLNNQVWSICQDKQKKFWFATSEGISVMDPQKERDEAFRNYTVENGLTANNARSLVCDRAGNVWAATWGGKVVKFDAGQNRFVQIPALNDIVYPLVSTLMIDRYDWLWIGTPEGIVCYNLSNGAIKTIRTIDGLSDNDISCLFEASNGEIWIGTKQKGITVYNRKVSERSTGRTVSITAVSLPSVKTKTKRCGWALKEEALLFTTARVFPIIRCVTD